MCRKIWSVKLSNTMHTAKNTKKQTKSHCQTWDSNLRPQAPQSDAFTSKPTGFNKVVLLLILYNVWINIFDRLSREVGITALLWLHFEQIWSQHIDMPSYKHTGNISINILFDINNPLSSLCTRSMYKPVHLWENICILIPRMRILSCF